AIADAADGFVGAPIRGHTGGAEIVEGAQGVVVPEWRKREASPVRVDDLAGRQAAQQSPFEEVGFAALASVCHGGRSAKGLLEGEQAFEHADGCMKRGSDGAAFGFTIPSAVG